MLKYVKYIYNKYVLCNILIKYITIILSNNLLDNLPFFKKKGFDPGLSARHIN